MLYSDEDIPKYQSYNIMTHKHHYKALIIIVLALFLGLVIKLHFVPSELFILPAEVPVPQERTLDKRFRRLEYPNFLAIPGWQ